MARRRNSKLEKRQRNKFYAKLYKRTGYAALERKEAVRQQKRDRINTREEEVAAQFYEYSTDDEEPELKGFNDVMNKMYECYGRKAQPYMKPKPPKTPEQIAAMAIPDEILPSGGKHSGGGGEKGPKKAKRNPAASGADKSSADAAKKTGGGGKVHNNYKLQMAQKAAKKKK